MKDRAESLLLTHGIRKTPFRIRVLELFLKASHSALRNKIIEQKLGQFDRITLYRTLKTFEKSKLIHEVVDGSNESKYALCDHSCSVHTSDKEHVHFLCTSCSETYCLNEVEDLKLNLPKSFKVEKIQVALSGVCNQCQS